MRHESGTFAGADNTRRLSGQDTPRVVIGGPEWLGTKEMNGVKDALRERGAIVSAYRADMMLHLEQFEAACKGGTHLVLFLDDKAFPQERQMIAAAKAAKIRKAAVICLGSVNALARHKQLFISGYANLVVTRSFIDNSKKTAILEYQVPFSLVAEDLASSAVEIARAVLIGWRP